MKPELTAQILGMYVGRPCDVEGLNNMHWITHTLITKRIQLDVAIIPHLRRLESITQEECREVYFLENGKAWESKSDCKTSYWDKSEDWYCTNRIMAIGTPKVWLYLLSRGFDLFGLIDAGLAKEVSE